MQASQDVCLTVAHDSPQVKSLDVITISEEQSTSGSNGKHPNLSLEIPSRPIIFTNFQPGESSFQPPDSTGSRTSSLGGFLRGLSFKKKRNRHDVEKKYLLNSDPQAVSGSAALNDVTSKYSWTRCASLPGPAHESSPTVPTPASARTAGEQKKIQKGSMNKKVLRSLSVPGRNIFVVRSLSFAASKEHCQLDRGDDQMTVVSPRSDNDEEIPEEEAICRICFDACEEGNTIKMECSCKGALKLIHEECAVKWFSMKRSKNCDVCGQEVLNLPVSLLRVPSPVQESNSQEQSRRAVNSRALSAWQDFVVLVLISTICYFFFLEQLLIQDMKTRAIIIAAPFAFTLGILASVLAAILAIREYMWTFAAVEFALVALILCLFYNVLHLNAVYAVLLSSVLGLSIATSLNSFYIHIFFWRVRVAENSSNV